MTDIDIKIVPASYVTEPATQTTPKCPDGGYRLAYPVPESWNGSGTIIFSGGEYHADVTYDHKKYNYDQQPVHDRVCIQETDKSEAHE